MTEREETVTTGVDTGSTDAHTPAPVAAVREGSDGEKDSEPPTGFVRQARRVAGQHIDRVQLFELYADVCDSNLASELINYMQQPRATRSARNSMHRTGAYTDCVLGHKTVGQHDSAVPRINRRQEQWCISQVLLWLCDIYGHRYDLVRDLAVVVFARDFYVPLGTLVTASGTAATDDVPATHAILPALHPFYASGTPLSPTDSEFSIIRLEELRALGAGAHSLLASCLLDSNAIEYWAVYMQLFHQWRVMLQRQEALDAARVQTHAAGVAAQPAQQQQQQVQEQHRPIGMSGHGPSAASYSAAPATRTGWTRWFG